MHAPPKPRARLHVSCNEPRRMPPFPMGERSHEDAACRPGEGLHVIVPSVRLPTVSRTCRAKARIRAGPHGHVRTPSAFLHHSTKNRREAAISVLFKTNVLFLLSRFCNCRSRAAPVVYSVMLSLSLVSLGDFHGERKSVRFRLRAN